MTSTRFGRRLRGVVSAVLICANLGFGACRRRQIRPSPASTVHSAATVGHPRLWITAADVPRLQGSARDTPCEAYAELFAFLSITSPSASDRQAFATRAHDLVMSVINEAAKGPDATSEIRSPTFSTDDRSRWYGEAFPLAVDWVYRTFSTDEKKAINDVFARWCDAIEGATTTTDNHPEPRGVLNDPALTADPIRVRWSGNNYYAAHMRNLGLMALALDPVDDADGRLRAHLASATGAWLYVTRALYTGDARGGLPVEGFEYGPQTLSYAAQLLWALQTAGQLDPAWGPGVTLADDRFWDDLLVAYPSALSPATVPDAQRGALYQPAWFGDGQHFLAPDAIDVLAPVGLLGAALNKPARLDGARFAARELGPGGASFISTRAHDTIYFRRAALYFLLFDPDAPPTPDLRASLPLQWLDAGQGRLYARTSWQPDAAWLTFNAGWTSIDHQTADGLDFSFYRHGEFLTKRRVGYGVDIATSDNHNSLALQNSQPEHTDGYRGNIWRVGSQWLEGLASGDGKIVAHSSGPGWLYALGDASPLYNSVYEGSTAVSYACRSIVWLQPDHVILYDRAASQPGRFKRLWLQLPQTPTITGNRAVATTPKGQQLVVTRLLPADGVLATDVGDAAAVAEAAELEPMHARLRSEAPSQAAEARWLHVLQGVDAGAAPDEPQMVVATSGAFDGVSVRGTAVMFPRAVYGSFQRLEYTVPTPTRQQLVVGLAPNASFAVQLTRTTSAIHVVVTHGGTQRSDSGGVLAF